MGRCRGCVHHSARNHQPATRPPAPRPFPGDKVAGGYAYTLTHPGVVGARDDARRSMLA